MYIFQYPLCIVYANCVKRKSKNKENSSQMMLGYRGVCENQWRCLALLFVTSVVWSASVWSRWSLQGTYSPGPTSTTKDFFHTTCLAQHTNQKKNWPKKKKRTSKTRKRCTRVWCDVFIISSFFFFFVAVNIYFRGTTT